MIRVMEICSSSIVVVPKTELFSRSAPLAVFARRQSRFKLGQAFVSASKKGDRSFVNGSNEQFECVTKSEGAKESRSLGNNLIGLIGQGTITYLSHGGHFPQTLVGISSSL